MRALTVCQPHAWALCQVGLKPYENRTWPTAHRGLVLVHASLTVRFDLAYPGQPPLDEMATGAVIGMADLVGCVRPSECGGHPYATGPWCHVFADPEMLSEPVPWKGALRYWVPPEALLKLVRERRRTGPGT